MNKLLAFLVLLVVAYLLLTKRKRPTSAGEDSAARGSTDKSPEKMVRCAYCGVHVPASESVSLEDGRHYCGEEHRRLDVDGPRR
jgi:uncharacterized protein